MADVSVRATLSVYAPRASVRTESIGPPPPADASRWSTTQARASGCCSGPPCRTRPDTTTCCDPPPPPPRRQSRASGLWSELAEIFRIEVLEVGLQRVGVERCGARLPRGLARFDGRQRKQAFTREDRRLEPQGDGDRVRRPRVDLDDRVAAVDVQLGVVGVVLHLRDEDLAELRAQAEDDLLQEVVRERTRELDARELHRDRARLRRADPDGEHALPFLFLQDHHRGVGRAVEAQVGDAHLDHFRGQVPSSQEARYFCCWGVNVSMAAGSAASFRRAISASTSRGRRCTALARVFAFRTTNSAARAWLANDMSMTLAGWPSAAARLISRPSASTKMRLPSSRHSSTNSRTRVGPCAACFRPSRSSSTLKWPEFASTAPSFIARMCSSRITFTFPVSVTNTSPTPAASAMGTTR